MKNKASNIDKLTQLNTVMKRMAEMSREFFQAHESVDAMFLRISYLTRKLMDSPPVSHTEKRDKENLVSHLSRHINHATQKTSEQIGTHINMQKAIPKENVFQEDVSGYIQELGEMESTYTHITQELNNISMVLSSL